MLEQSEQELKHVKIQIIEGESKKKNLKKVFFPLVK